MENETETKKPKYRPPIWFMRDEERPEVPPTPGTFSRLPYVKTLEDVDVIVAGIPYDSGTTGRPGTRLGPKAIREAYGMVPYMQGFGIEDAFDYISAVDYGDFKLINGDTKRSFATITEEMTKILKTGVIPVILGGDHSITYPELLAYRDVYGPVSLIHFDSHTDTWGGPESLDYPDHANPFRNAILTGCLDTEHSIQVGMRGLLKDEHTYDFAKEHNFEHIYAADIHRMGIYECAKKIREKVGDNKVMVTFDIDFVDPSVCPGTGTPVPGGFTSWETLELVRSALTGLNIVGFDMVEVAPNYDPMENTQLVANRICCDFINIVAANKAGIKEYEHF